MLVDVWVDVVCPWAYLSQDRSAALSEMGIEVRSRLFELHPRLPAAGVDVRPGGRLAATFSRVGSECAAAGLPFRAPSRTANSHEALEWASAVALVDPSRYEEAVGRLFRARFVDDLDPSGVAVREVLEAELGLDADAVAGARADGRAARHLLADRRSAEDAGVAATPAWVFPTGFVIPGVQPIEQMRRWASRLLRAAPAPARPDPAGR